MKHNYRLPDDCCGKCIASYQSDYGDYQCLQQIGSTIDIGGICDKYEHYTETVHLEQKAVTEPLPVDKSCDGCKCLFESGVCIITGKVSSKVCKEYDDGSDRVVSVAVDSSDAVDLSIDVDESDSVKITDGSCVSCDHSYVYSVDNLPHCNVDQSVIYNVNECCSNYTEAISEPT